jgi:DNA replication and repair protein RecF
MIEYLEVKNFRNHDFKKIEINSKTTFIEGSNGQGKTSLLEALYFVSLLKSHRTSDDSTLIQSNKPFAKIIVKTTKHTYEVVIQKDSKHLNVDKNQIKKMSQFVGGYKVIMFSPEDLELIKGHPGIRRRFMDIEMYQVKPKYLEQLSVYKQVLKQRNALLKRLKLSDDLTFLKIINKRLSEEANKIIHERTQFIDHLNQALINRFKDFNQTDRVSIIYKPNTPLNSLEGVLNDKIERDILSQTTSSGPHRDDFIIQFNGAEAKEFASQGQQRLITIALKLSLIELIDKDEELIILLDDVLSELDEQAVKEIGNIVHSDYQVIMTGTHSNYENVNLINLNEGDDEYATKQQQ